MKKICVFCGSSPGAKTQYVKSATALGEAFVTRGIGLVYGGASVGAMGCIARTVLGFGGNVTGVIPKGLVDKEVAFTDLPDLRVVNTMHERKSLMMELSDGFIALPGGLGTIEEFFEALTWGQLGMHQKPCGLLNVCGYYDRLFDFLDDAVNQRFMEKAHREMILMDENADALLDKFEKYDPPCVDKAAWILQINGDVKGA